MPALISTRNLTLIHMDARYAYEYLHRKTRTTEDCMVPLFPAPHYFSRHPIFFTTVSCSVCSGFTIFIIMNNMCVYKSNDDVSRGTAGSPVYGKSKYRKYSSVYQPWYNRVLVENKQVVATGKIWGWNTCMLESGGMHM